MNHRMIRYILAWIIRLEGIFLVLPCVIALIYREFSQSLVYLAFAVILFVV